MSTAFDGFTFSGPCNLGSRVAGERNLDDYVLALVKEGSVAEARRYVDLGSGLDDQLRSGRLGSSLVDSPTDVLVSILACD